MTTPGRVLTATISLKCEAAWLARIDRRARRCGMSRSAYIRATADGVRPHEQPDRGYHELARQLAKIGTLYNQTVRLAHQTRYRTGQIPSDLLLDQLNGHQATLRTILDALLGDPNESTP